MKHEEEKVLTEAAPSVQDAQVKPLYMDSSITDLITQVIGIGVDLIRFAGDGKRRFAIYYGGAFLNIWETKIKDDGTHEFVRDLVDVLIDANKGDELKIELLRACQTMCREIRASRYELDQMFGKERWHGKE